MIKQRWRDLFTGYARREESELNRRWRELFIFVSGVVLIYRMIILLLVEKVI